MNLGEMSRYTQNIFRKKHKVQFSSESNFRFVSRNFVVESKISLKFGSYMAAAAPSSLEDILKTAGKLFVLVFIVLI